MKKTIALIIPTASQTIERSLMKGIRSRLDSSKFKLLLLVVDYLPIVGSAKDAQRWIHSRVSTLGIDGVIFYGGGIGYQAKIEDLIDLMVHYKNFPLVNIGCALSGIPSVIVDNKTGIAQISKHLIEEKNCRSFAFLLGPEGNQEANDRFESFKQELDSHRLDIPELMIWKGEFSSASGRIAISDYINRGQSLPDAIVCANDLSAKGVVDGLTENGFRVPEDILVTGFDDFEYAENMYIPLTSADYPAKRVGAKASDLLLKQMDNIPVDQLTQEPSQAVFRQSTGSTFVASASTETEGQWSLIKQRDMNASRLVISREFNMRSSLHDIFDSIADKFYAAGIIKLFLFPFTGLDAEDSNQTLHRNLKVDPIKIINGVYESFAPISIKEMINKDQTENPEKETDWVLCPLLGVDYAFGYILAEVTSEVSDFVEFLGHQISDVLNNELMHLKSETLQNQVAKNEKLAALGGLVSGVAHEINTPLGVSLLATSHLNEELETINKLIKNESLKKSDLDSFVELCGETTSILMSSLNRAADLINNFKQVAVDQTAEDKRVIDLKGYVESILKSLSPEIKRSSVEIQTDLQQGIKLETYPGAWAQLITNFTINAITHAFEANQKGTINIKLYTENSHYCLIFQDNGKGMNTEVAAKIFDPFFTTRREYGGSGLGLHIAYNLVTQNLGGTIDVKTAINEGTRFSIKIPFKKVHSLD